MSIEVRWFSTLVPRTASKSARTVVPWNDGITPRSIFTGEGFSDVDADHVMAVVDGEQVEMDARLDDGATLEFLVGISGGSGEYQATLDSR